MAPTVKIRPYKDFLTPLMHRRFAGATAILSFACYSVSLLIGEWDSWLWSWFPLGRAGIRAALIFIPSFSIFILRVAQLHVGIQTSFSGFDAFKRHGPSFQVVQTVGWYIFSAWLFAQIYIYSARKNLELEWVTIAPRTDRMILNERPIYLISFCMFLGIVQAGVHLFFDYDRIELPIAKRPEAGSTASPPQVARPGKQIGDRLIRSLQYAVQRVVIVAIISPFLYCMGTGIYPYSVRQFGWSITRSWTRLFWNLPRTSSLPVTKPFHAWMIFETMRAGFYLTMLWEIANAGFSVYVAQEPLKNERPITYESRDPNGSLLTGLKGKKLQTQAFAFWELSSIAERFEGRRKAIYEDIDRKGGSAWSQILAVCLAVLTDISIRIAEFERPSPPPTYPAQVQAATGLPRMAPPIKQGISKNGDIFTAEPKPASTSEGALRAVGSYAKNHGNSPPPAGLPPMSKKLLAQAAALVPPEQQAIASKGFSGIFRDWAMRAVRFEFIGQLFRQEYRRRIAAIVFGTPYGEVGLVVDAIYTLTRLAICSLTEDKYGNVQRDVKLIITTFTSTISRLEAFKNTLPIHWTDIEGKRESPEVDTVVTALKTGLGQLVDAFAPYAVDMRLTQAELRQAREAARLTV